MSAERERLRERLRQAAAFLRAGEGVDTLATYVRHAATCDEALALLDSEPEPDARYVVVGSDGNDVRWLGSSVLFSRYEVAASLARQQTEEGVELGYTYSVLPVGTGPRVEQWRPTDTGAREAERLHAAADAANAANVRYCDEIERLRGALEPFARFACGDPEGTARPGCDCHNCNARRAHTPETPEEVK